MEIPYIRTVHFEQVHPLHYIPIPSSFLPFLMYLVGLIMLYLSMYM
jgi:hypothetical protein